MYKVMIVDDEQWILKDLAQLIDWEQIGFRIVAEAGTGVEAEMLVNRHHPDLIICDIRMPGISGLELLGKLRAKRYRNPVIFLTAYEDFAYAREAVRLGALDYILKPIRKNDLLEALSRVALRLEENEVQNKRLREHEIGTLFYELLEQKTDKPDFRKKLEQLGLSLHTAQYRLVIVKCDEPAEPHGLDLARDETFALFRDVSWLSTQLGSCKRVYMLSGGIKETTGLRQALRQLNGRLRPFNATIGVSLPQSSLTRFREAYRQADVMANQAFMGGSGRLYVYRRLGGITPLLAELRSCSSPRRIGEWIAKLGSGSRFVHLEAVAKLYNACLHRLAELGIGADAAPAGELELPHMYRDFRDVLDTLGQYASGIPERPAKTPENSVVRNVLADIAERYGSKLLIADYAAKYRMNSSYLSQLFKQEVGESFTEVLMKVRMSKAVELLGDDRLSIDEISERVGYDDHFHFRKMFKKHYQVTPSVYRRKRAST